MQFFVVFLTVCMHLGCPKILGTLGPRLVGTDGIAGPIETMLLPDCVITPCSDALGEIIWAGLGVHEQFWDAGALPLGIGEGAWLTP